MAFKEWAAICEMLGSGRQTIILRRGGIAEGRQGFSFEGHESFFLYPTLFHEENTAVTETVDEPRYAPNPIEPGSEGEVEITLAARCHFAVQLDDWESVRALEPFHVWSPGVIEDRFKWREKNQISLAVVRVYRLEQPWRFANNPNFGGCKSWIVLPNPPAELKQAPALSDTQFAEQVQLIDRALPGIELPAEISAAEMAQPFAFGR